MTNRGWMKRLNHKAAALLAATAFCQSAAAQILASANSDPAAAVPVTITTPQGELLGEMDPVKPNVRVFKGIPYAQPPVGDLRWRAPQPIGPWQGVRDARHFANFCTQMLLPARRSRLGGRIDTEEYARRVTYVGSEDCLYLNVWAPNASSGAKRPVMLWIHGGGNVYGDAHIPRGARLADAGDVVVVSVGYRLGLFGFLGHPALQAQPGESANYGLLDQIAALKWVRANIGAFGGDPDNVTIFGLSGGGHDVLGLISSPAAAGLFHRAIPMGGYIHSDSVSDVGNYVDDEKPGLPRGTAEMLLQLMVYDGSAPDRAAAKARVRTMTPAAIAAYLRSKSYRDIELAGFRAIDRYKARVVAYAQMVRDGVTIPVDGMWGSFRRGAYNKVPILLGNTRNEYQRLMFYSGSLTDEVQDAPEKLYRIRDRAKFRLMEEYLSALWVSTGSYDRAAELALHQPDKVFQYRLDWDEAGPWPDPDAEPFGAVHGLDATLMFGAPPDMFPKIVGPVIPPAAAPGYERLSEAVVSYWAQFARTGDPGRGLKGNLPKWAQWGKSGQVMLLDSEAGGGLRMTTADMSQAALWEKLRQDPRLPTLKEKCDFLHEMEVFPFEFGMIGAAERHKALGGKCL